MLLNLQERAAVVKAVWPDELDVTRVLLRCATVHDVELGIGTPTLSRKERERIEEELSKAERNG